VVTNNSNNMPQMLKAMLTGSAVPRRTTAPAYSFQKPIGTNGRFYTKFALRVLPPNFKYPNASLTLQLSNGAGSCFCRIELEELIELLNAVQSEVPKLQQVWESQKLAERSLIEQMATIEQMQRALHLTQDSDEDQPIAPEQEV